MRPGPPADDGGLDDEDGPGRDLTTDQLEFLLRAMQAKWLVLPYFKVGNGSTRCLVSFGLTPKPSYVDDVTK